MPYRPVYICNGLKPVITNIEINGIVAQLYETVYDYVSRNAKFSGYEDEKVDVSYISDKDRESKLPIAFVRQILLYKDLNFQLGNRYLKV